MRFFDAHCDTIGPILESGADFMAEPDGGGAAGGVTGGGVTGGGAAASGAKGALVPHVTLPGLRAGGIGAQVFASWVWSGKYKGREYEAAMAKVEAVRDLCAAHPGDLALASNGADLARPFGADGALAGCTVDAGTAVDDRARIAVLPSLEGADPLLGDVDNLFAFYEAGVRLLTLAWGDNAFCGSAFGDGSGLTKKGADLVAACESLGVIVDVSHLSDKGFTDLCLVAERPFVASHSNCRSVCPSKRNMTDDMIRALAGRGGVMGITLAPGFLSAEYHAKEEAVTGRSFQAVVSGEATFEDAQNQGADAMAAVPRPPLSTVVDHVKWAINVGGEDSVGLGGDLDGVDFLPAGFDGAADYPKIETLLRDGGLSPRQIDKVCHENFLRVFQEILG
jgi:membrane dipeptidase